MRGLLLPVGEPPHPAFGHLLPRAAGEKGELAVIGVSSDLHRRLVPVPGRRMNLVNNILTIRDVNH
jgi:hypothetical protein